MQKVLLSYFRTILFYAIICYSLILLSGLITHSFFSENVEIFDIPVSMLISLAAAFFVTIIFNFSKKIANIINDSISILSVIKDFPNNVPFIFSSSVFTSMLLFVWIISVIISASFVGKITSDLLGFGKSTATHGLLGMLIVSMSGYYNWLHNVKRQLTAGGIE